MCCTDKCKITTEVLTASENIQLPTTANDRLKNQRITSISIPRSGSNTLKTRLKNTVANDTVIATAHLILKNADGTEKVTIPLWLLQRDYNAPEPMRFDLEGIDLTQCFITLDSTAANYNAAHAIEITFGFDCPNC